MRSFIRCVGGAVVVAGLGALGLAQGGTVLASRNAQGQQATYLTGLPALSANARYVTFWVWDDGFVAGDSNEAADIVRKDLLTGALELVSVTPSGTSGNDVSMVSRISDDGRFVVFESYSNNLLAGTDSNGALDVFVRDMLNGVTLRASVSNSGGQANADSWEPSISADARFVAFTSLATNLVPGDTNGVADVFLRDRTAQTTQRISFGPGGQGTLDSRSPSISADGRYVAFGSYAALLPTDVNGLEDVYVRDRQLGTLTLASVGPGGVQGNYESTAPSISLDGRWLAFWSNATTFVAGDTNGEPDVFLADRAGGSVIRVSSTPAGFAGFEHSRDPVVSRDGRRVVYFSMAPDVGPRDLNGAGDVLAYEVASGLTTIVSLDADGRPGSDHSSAVALDPLGRYAAFESWSRFAGDANGALIDIFVRDLAPAAPERYCSSKPSSLGCLPTLAASGTCSASAAVPFVITASSVNSGTSGLFLHSLAPCSFAYAGGRLCGAGPWWRGTLQFSGGGPAADCTGSLTYDFNAVARSGLDPRLVAGTVVGVQAWFRDAADSTGFGCGLSDALRFLLAP